VNDPARDVADVLAVGCEHGNQKHRSSMVQVRRPDHIVLVAQCEDGGNGLEQCRFVVGYFLREQMVPISVGHDAVMAAFAGVDTGSYVHEELPPVCRLVDSVEPSRYPRRRIPIRRNHVAVLNARPGPRRVAGGQPSRAVTTWIVRPRRQCHTRLPRVARTLLRPRNHPANTMKITRFCAASRTTIF
jgi:hypothetical protein